MSFPRKIIKVRPLGGIVNDIPPFEVAPEFYTSGDNMHFRQSFAERTQGHAPVYIAQNSGVQNDTTNFLDGGDIDAFDFGATQDFTIELWMKHSGGAQSTKSVLGKRDGNDAGWEILFNETNEDVSLVFEDDVLNLVASTITDGCPDDGEWHHCAWIVDRTNDVARTYRATVLEGIDPIGSVTGPLDAGTEPFRIFADNLGAGIWENGSVDEVRIWDDIRTQPEIEANWKMEIDPASPNLIAYWKMNGNLGDSVVTIPDETAGGSTLTDTGAGDILHVDSSSAFTFSSLTTLRNLINVIVDVTNYWVYHGIDKSSVVTGGVHTDITKSGGITGTSTANKITSGLLNGVHFMNNSVDAPMFWPNSPSLLMETLPGWPASTFCKSMRAFKFHLFAMDISKPAGEFPMQVLWSDAAPPGAVPLSWTPAASNEAGDVELSQTPGRIIDGAALRSSFAIYKSHSAYVADYVGGNNIFNFRRMFITAGVLTRNCIADYRGRHFVVTDGDVILTDGSVGESIADNRMRKFLFNQLDQTNFENTFVVPFAKNNEIWICFPAAGSTFCNLALIWDGVANAWGVRELPDITHAASGIISDTTISEAWDDDPRTWDSDTTTWNEQLFSNADDRLLILEPNDTVPTLSQFLEVDAGKTFDGANITANVIKQGMAFDEPNRVKFLRRLIPHVVAENGTQIQVRVGSQMIDTEPIMWSNPVTFTCGVDSQIDTFAQGKYLSAEFSSAGLNPWALTGFDIEAELRGYH